MTGSMIRCLTRARHVRRWVETVRHLRWQQIAARMLPQGRVTLDRRPPPPRRPPPSPWLPSPKREPVLIGPRTIRLLGRTREWTAREDWQGLDPERLWMLHLHYWDDLNCRGAQDRQTWQVDLLAQWVDDHDEPPRIGWEPYAVSRRLVNWAVASWQGFPMSEAAVGSLAVQARYLARRFEYRVLGNHLLANAKALIFAGTFFSGPEATRWLHSGLHVFHEQLCEQVLADGGHFELSPMYHSLVLEDVLDLLNLRQCFHDVPELAVHENTWRGTARRMLWWLSVMVHPDGSLARFNDTAEGMSPTPGQLRAYARQLAVPDGTAPCDPITFLQPSGYVRLQDDRTVVLIDVGRIGPDYLPAHAHADSLSFEASWDGRRWLVNRGTSLYEAGAERLAQRGTAAHNTVEINGQDSSEVWDAFRVARRAYPRDVAIDVEADGTVRVRGAHDGYLRLPGRVEHRRAWTLRKGVLSVDDELSGSWQQSVVRCHLHPQISAFATAHGGFVLRDPSGEGLSVHAFPSIGCIVPSTYHPEFGCSVATQSLEWRMARHDHTLRLAPCDADLAADSRSTPAIV